jgi:hypothetical protein
MTFKPSTHRKCFIDRKIREKSYPTAASLARDYQAEFGVKVDPRTIANDIASMRQDFGAPIHFDNENGGYFYTDPAYNAEIFQNSAKDIPLGAIGLGGIAAMGLDPSLLPLIPSSLFLSEWHRTILQSLVDNICPEQLKKTGNPGKISLVSTDSGRIAPQISAILNALEQNLEVSISFALPGCKTAKQLFRPLHRLCFTNSYSRSFSHYILGSTPGGGAPYLLLNEDYLKSAAPSGASFAPLKSIQIQPHTENILTFILSFGDFDTILLFVTKPRPNENIQDPAPLYTMLTRMDIFL